MVHTPSMRLDCRRRKKNTMTTHDRAHKGWKARAAKLTPAARSASARHAVQARWATGPAAAWAGTYGDGEPCARSDAVGGGSYDTSQKTSWQEGYVPPQPQAVLLWWAQCDERPPQPPPPWHAGTLGGPPQPAVEPPALGCARQPQDTRAGRDAVMENLPNPQTITVCATVRVSSHDLSRTAWSIRRTRLRLRRASGQI